MNRKHNQCDDTMLLHVVDQPNQRTVEAEKQSTSTTPTIPQNITTVHFKLEQMLQHEEQLSIKQDEFKQLLLQINMDKQAICKRTECVEIELDKAQRMVDHARKAVSNINKNQLNEIKCLKNPPRLLRPVFFAIADLMYPTLRATKKKQPTKHKSVKLVDGYTRSRSLPPELRRFLHENCQ
eukprot:802005_1